MPPGVRAEAAKAELAFCISPEPPCKWAASNAVEFKRGPATCQPSPINGPLSSDSEGTATTLDGSASKCKSAKRRAAEALLERKASRQRLDLLDTSHYTSSRVITVQACDSSSQCAATLPSREGVHSDARWCQMPVVIPTLDWPAILRSLTSQHSASNRSYQMPEGVDVRLVDTHADLAPSLAALRESMTDSVIAIDLEWRPDYRPGSNNKVALIQLATATTCVLVRSCRLGWTLPAALQHFFSDPSLVFVSFSWDSCDEDKMKSTFGAGKSCFGRFLDLQQVAESLGYHSCGLAKLTERVLGVTMPKSRTVSRSDWQRPGLTPAQVQYAALDALITGNVFRGLRLWHASPSPCTACKTPLGVPEAASDRTELPLNCLECKKPCRHVHGLLCHMKSTGHAGGAAQCGECGRVRFT